MISIPSKVEEIVNTSPYLREAMTDYLINLSGLARHLQPRIAEELKKPVTAESIFMALQRLQKKLEPFYEVNPAEYLANLGLRSDLFEITVKNSSTLLSALSKLSASVRENHTNVFVFTQGMDETTVITSKVLRQQLLEAIEHEKITNTIDDLTGITMQRTHGQIETTGVLQYPLRILAWQGISVIEIVTTLNDIMIIVRDFEVDQALISIRRALKNLDSKS